MTSQQLNNDLIEINSHEKVFFKEGYLCNLFPSKVYENDQKDTRIILNNDLNTIFKTTLVKTIEIHNDNVRDKERNKVIVN